MKDARAHVERLRAEIPDDFARLRDLDFTTRLSDQITLSTFHGCPAHEIEGIARFLLTEMDVHVTVKLNPTLLGRETVDGILHGLLGYHEIETRPEDFEKDLQWDQALEITDRLTELARVARPHLPGEVLEHPGGAEPPRVLPAVGVGDVPLGRAAARDHAAPGRPLDGARGRTCRSRSRPASTAATSRTARRSGSRRSRPAPTCCGRAATAACRSTWRTWRSGCARWACARSATSS